jgi:hypothetical protein
MTRKTPTIGGRPKADHKSCATRFVQPSGNRVFGNPDCPPNRGGHATPEIRPPWAPTTCRSSLFSEPDLANPGPRFISSPRQQTVVMLTAPPRARVSTSVQHMEAPPHESAPPRRFRARPALPTGPPHRLFRNKSNDNNAISGPVYRFLTSLSKDNDAVSLRQRRKGESWRYRREASLDFPPRN